jgi:hypothetical protein
MLYDQRVPMRPGWEAVVPGWSTLAKHPRSIPDGSC